MTSASRKIFGIGLPFSGDNILAHALAGLRYPVTWLPATLNDLHLAPAAVQVWQPIVQLDDLYPDALYILTMRRQNEWFNDCKITQAEPLNTQDSPNPFWRYERSSWHYLYEARQAELRHHIHPNKILPWGPYQENNWTPLCRFLDQPTPDFPFPNPTAVHQRPLTITVCPTQHWNPGIA